MRNYAHTVGIVVTALAIAFGAHSVLPHARPEQQSCPAPVRQEVDCRTIAASPGSATIFVFGQSLLSNESDVSGCYAAGPKVYNFNFQTGRCYAAQDPLLGTLSDRANVTTRVGDLLVRRGTYSQVILVPAAYSASFVADWAPGGHHHERLVTALKRANAAGLTIDLAMWQQGEAESNHPGADAAAWTAKFLSMEQSMRRVGFSGPIYVARSTVCGDAPSPVIREAQASVVQLGQNVRAGPDTDVIPLEERFDRCHLGKVGLQHAAELWADALQR